MMNAAKHDLPHWIPDYRARNDVLRALFHTTVLCFPFRLFCTKEAGIFFTKITNANCNIAQYLLQYEHSLLGRSFRQSNEKILYGL